MSQTETTIDISQINTSSMDYLTSVTPTVTLWTGTRRMTAKDLQVDTADLPPVDLATLGSKKVFDPKKLAVFSSLKYEAVSLLKRYGINSYGYLIPDTLVDHVMASLKDIQARFQKEKDNLIQNYDADVQAWLEKHPDWEHVIRPHIENKDVVRARLSFGWRTVKLSLTPSGDGSDFIAESNKELADLLFAEIACTAAEAEKKSYLGKTSVTRKALSPLKVIEAKLRGLVFIDPLVAPVISMIETTITSLPKRGMITGVHLDMLKGLISRLSNADSLKQDAMAILSGQQVSFTQEEMAEQDGDEAGIDDSADLSADDALPTAEEVHLPEETAQVPVSEPASRDDDLQASGHEAQAEPFTDETIPTFTVEPAVQTAPVITPVPAPADPAPEPVKAEEQEKPEAATAAPVPHLRRPKIIGMPAQARGVF